jgi:hypothetical protein
MKRIRFGVFALFVGFIYFSFPSSTFAASPPALFFTDLESGPKTGGENNNGAFVTLYGNNFGTSPTVTVGGGQAIIKLAPATYLWYQKMTIQLGANANTGNIVVTTSDGSSNGVPFTVRTGNIRFVGTQSGDVAGIVACKNAMSAGDICYVRAGQSASGEDNYAAVVVFSNSGTASNPVALVAYPGAQPTISNARGRGVYFYGGSYLVLAGFKITEDAALEHVSASNIRSVGNELVCPNGSGQSACSHVESSNYVSMLGNYVHDTGTNCGSDCKQYHSIYYTTNSNHATIAWNEVFPNYGGCRAIQFYSTGGADQYDLHVHDNYIHDGSCDGINFATVNPNNGVVEAYNNLVVKVGAPNNSADADANKTCVNLGSSGNPSTPAEVYNNTFYDCGSSTSSNDAGSLSPYIRTRLRNNIFYQLPGEKYLSGGSQGSASNLSGSNNLWYGVSGAPTQTTGNITTDPKFASTASRNFHLLAGSPAIGAGTAISTLLYDIEGYQRATPLDLGAYNFGSYVPDTTPPTSTTNLVANATSQSSITLTWTAATDNVAVTGYTVERCQGTGCTTFTQVGTPSASPFVDSGLTANTFYNYHVRATDAAGNLSGWSNVVGATTQAPDTQAPTTPANLTASASSSSTINLTWTASTDNVAVTGYKVERCSGASCTTFTQIGTPTTNSYSDTGLSASTLYRYQVRATDSAGNNSAYSNISSATTPQAPPSPTFLSEYETPWNSATSPKTTGNFSVQSGDTLVAYAVNESSGSTIATPPTGTLTGTWTLRQTLSTSGFTALRLWTMNVASNQTNVNVTFTNSSGNFGGDVLHFRNASGIGVTAQANSTTGNPSLTLNGVEENSTLVMVNGDWSAKTGARTYNTTQAGAFTETSAFADGSSYGVEAGYYANAGAAGNKTIGLTAPSGMTWALAAVEVKGNSTPPPAFTPCNTVTTANFSQSAYNSYGAPFDAFQTSTTLINATCSSSNTHTIQATLGQTGDTTRIVYTKGYYYTGSAWTQYSGTCTGALNGEWCQGSVSATITNPNISTASAAAPAYFVGMTCSVQGGGWKCGCRDTTCNNFYWQIQGAGM